MRLRVARLALALYPQAWRERYGEELAALVEERPPSLRATLDLLRGAADAHLHPGGLQVSGLDRMRNTVAAVLCCWIAVVVAGTGFAKLTEDRQFSRAADAHPLLADARTAITVLAVVAAAAVALAGAPLVLRVLREAWRQRRRPLVIAVMTPFAAGGAFLLVTAAVVLLAHGGLPDHSALDGLVFSVWAVAGVAAAAACGLGSRAALLGCDLRAPELRVGVRGALAVSAAIAAIAIATGIYTVALAADAPGLASSGSGPFSIDTAILLAFDALAMAAAATLAAVSAKRGLAAARP